MEAERDLREYFDTNYNPYEAEAYIEAKEREAVKQEVADMLGSGQIMESLSDEILEDIRQPRSEIMDIDMTEYATQRESVIPPEIQKFIYPKPSFLGRIINRFRKYFGGG